MKLTKSKLQEIIQEEFESIYKEVDGQFADEEPTPVDPRFPAAIRPTFPENASPRELRQILRIFDPFYGKTIVWELSGKPEGGPGNLAISLSHPDVIDIREKILRSYGPPGQAPEETMENNIKYIFKRLTNRMPPQKYINYLRGRKLVTDETLRKFEKMAGQIT
jgi:hypothetical protein